MQKLYSYVNIVYDIDSKSVTDVNCEDDNSYQSPESCDISDIILNQDHREAVTAFIEGNYPVDNPYCQFKDIGGAKFWMYDNPKLVTFNILNFEAASLWIGHHVLSKYILIVLRKSDPLPQFGFLPLDFRLKMIQSEFSSLPQTGNSVTILLNSFGVITDVSDCILFGKDTASERQIGQPIMRFIHNEDLKLFCGTISRLKKLIYSMINFRFTNNVAVEALITGTSSNPIIMYKVDKFVKMEQDEIEMRKSVRQQQFFLQVLSKITNKIMEEENDIQNEENEENDKPDNGRNLNAKVGDLSFVDPSVISLWKRSKAKFVNHLKFSPFNIQTCLSIFYKLIGTEETDCKTLINLKSNQNILHWMIKVLDKSEEFIDLYYKNK